MTYFGVLLRFIGIPIIVLMMVAAYDRRQGKELPPVLASWSPTKAVLLHALVALAYTTPWDNYLVANRIWWYDPALVTGLTLGWVPIEEYTFFVVQTWMSGLWLLTCARRLPPPPKAVPLRPGIRRASLGAAGVLWALWLALLLSGWTRGLYMSILLVWALPPIALQLAFGADILWHHRQLVVRGLLPPTLYLWVVDALAISGGTWTINPANTIGLDLAGILPLEEAVFFLVTNTLIVFGIVLLLARKSHQRFESLRQRR